MAKAGVISIDVNAGVAQFLVDMDKSNAKLQQFGKGAQDAGAHTVSSMQASSAAIRLLENPLGNNIRAIERLISLSPALTKMARSAFLFVGIGAATSLVVKLGDEVFKFYQSIEQAPERIKGAFRGMNDGLKLTNDELALANDRLRNDIAKLEGKPQNGLAVALDEARVFADKLAESLDKDLAALNKLLKENEIGVFKSILAGVRTDDLRKELGGETGSGGFTGKIDAINDAGNAKISGSKTKGESNAARAELAKNLTDAYDVEIKQLEDRLKTAQGLQKTRETDGSFKYSARYLGSDQSSNIEETQASLRALQRQRSFVGLSNANQSLTENKTGLEAGKSNLDTDLQKQKEEYNRQLDEFETYQQALSSEKLGFRQQELANIIAQYGQQKDVVVKFEDELRTEIAKLSQSSFKETEAARDKDLKDEQRYQLDLLAIKNEWARNANESLKSITKSMGENTGGDGKELPNIAGMPTAARLQNAPIGPRLALQNAGIQTVAVQEDQIRKQEDLLNLLGEINAPLAAQLALRMKILEAQIALDNEEGKDTTGERRDLSRMEHQQSVTKTRSQRGIDLGGDLNQAEGAIPGALGGAISTGIMSGQKGDSVGKEVANAMKSIGMHLLGDVVKQMIEKMIATTIGQFALNMLNNWLIHYASNPLGLFAAGGDPDPGKPFIAGEKGPEIIHPQGQRLTVIPNHALGGLGSFPSPSDYMQVSAAASAPDGHTFNGGHTFNVTNHIYESSDPMETGRHLTNLMKTMLPNSAQYSS